MPPSRAINGIEPGQPQTNQESAMLAQRRPTNKIQQDEKQQSGPQGDAAASQPRGGSAPAGNARKRSPSAGDAREERTSVSNNKIQRPSTLVHVALPPATSLPRSPKAYAAPHRSPRQAQGFKPQAVDRDSIRLIMDDVLQKHTNQILQALDNHTSTILESSAGPELYVDSMEEASVAYVDPARGPAGSSASQQRVIQDPGQAHVPPPKMAPVSEVARVEEYEKEILSPTSGPGNSSWVTTWGGVRRPVAKQQSGVFHMEIPPRGELLAICKKLGKGKSFPMVEEIEEWLDWWDNVKNPKGTRPIDKFVNSYFFAIACVMVIIANTVFVAIDANTQMENYVQGVEDEVKVEQYVFIVLYIAELVIRAVSEGRYFFYGENMKWNWFDMAIIVTSIIGDFLVSKNSWSFLRAARVLKVVKVTRVFRALHLLGFNELQRMVMQVLRSLSSLLWCFVLLAFITYVFAIFFVYSLCDLPNVADEHLAELLDFFGSVTLAMLTLLQATTGGVDWRDVHDLLDEAGGMVAFCFVLYVLFFVIAVWNIITATFVEKMAKMAKPDNDAVAMEERMKNFEVAVDLKELLSQMDLDASQTISHAELKACLASPPFQDFLLAHGVHIYEASTFFEMLFECGDVDALKIDTIVAYCLRIKGQATSLDLHTMRYELANGQQRLLALLEDLEGHVAQATRRKHPVTSPCSNGRARDGSVEPHGGGN